MATTSVSALRALCAVLALWLPFSAFADKTDVVEFGSSRMVGEVKGLERGKLRFKTDATDTIDIDWADVKTLITDQRLRIERRDGGFEHGSLRAGAETRRLALATSGGVQMVSMGDVVSFEPIESSFWERLDIDTSLGYSYAKSNDVSQLNFNASFEYDTDDRSRDLSLSSQRSGSEGNEESLRRTLDYLTVRIRESQWFTGWRSGYEDNDELSLDYRVLGAAIVGRDFYPRSDRRIRLFTGPAVTMEQYTDTDSQTGAEFILASELDWFRFTHPEVDLSTTLIVFPSLSDFGRVRASLDIALRWEIVKDLYWELTLYDDYDNETVNLDDGTSSSSNDYGITTSLGWSW